jgi:hypothetical protein
MDLHQRQKTINRERAARPGSACRFLRLGFFLVVCLFLSGFHADPLLGEVAPADPAAPVTGRVIDDATGLPLPDATVTLDGAEVVHTNGNGLFPVRYPLRQVAARAPGYRRTEIAGAAAEPPIELRLQAIRPKALYLTVYGVSSRIIRNEALKLVEETELNALVIDVKGDRGFIPYKSDIPLATAIGAQKLKLIGDIKGLLQSLKAKGIYTIARIVVFKDDLLGSARPDLAIKTTAGTIWKDREQLIWVDPSKKEVWNYNIAIAVEAAQLGFDEIQFDYVRFPDRRGLKFAIANTQENRISHIEGFLTEAKKQLLPYNVFLAADIFGYVAWNLDDTQIGQKIDRLATAVDYISLMLYPSGFHLGIPNYRNSVASTYEIVFQSMKRAQERTQLPSVRFRPWLQAFRDYAFDKRLFTGTEIRKQINAAEDFGANGWMLWNPRNSYAPDGLKEDTEPAL